MLRIITDFDGPIMDVSERYYQVYQFCLDRVREPEQAVKQLSKEEFWDLKRAQVPERRIGKISELHDDQAGEFARLRRQTVHTLPYLVYDRPLPGAIAALQRMQQLGIELVTMTMRRTRELNAALTQHDLGQFFHPDRRYCLSDDHAKTNDVEDKTWLMGKALAEMPAAAETWMIGDTEADILAAKTHAIPVIAVLSGIRNRDCLAAHDPTTIVEDLNAALDTVLQKTSFLTSR
jgi:phosphoglycolate phosphatase-like HAD superfamily hydrolase